MLQNLGTLGTKLLKRDTHNTYQRLIIDAELVLLGKFIKGGLLDYSWAGL
mgnify:FL=1